MKKTLESFKEFKQNNPKLILIGLVLLTIGAVAFTFFLIAKNGGDSSSAVDSESSASSTYPVWLSILPFWIFAINKKKKNPTEEGKMQSRVIIGLLTFLLLLGVGLAVYFTFN